ncbi:protein YgfX [Photobacterium profundum]|uniref:protein YgfX n=1 Tax=Photobacterium profundum TaxID=74109 RepID=UPI003D0D9983
MLLIITASFVNLRLHPSQKILAALSTLYLGVAIALFVSLFMSWLPQIVVIFLLECLWIEWLERYQHYCHQQGNLSITVSGAVNWQQQKWQINKIKVVTRWFILFRMQHAQEVSWVCVSHDACKDEEYRALAMLCHMARL